jgi:hypothetical protein
MAHLIDKDRVVAEIKERIDRDNEKAASYPDNSETDYLYRVKEAVYKDLLSFLDTLEVKEVDLNAAVERYVEQHKSELQGYMDIRRIARHFFELGLKAQKGE